VAGRLTREGVGVFKFGIDDGVGRSYGRPS